MGIQGMVQSVRYNALQLGKRKKMHERPLNNLTGLTGDLSDTPEMTTHEFAEFQKELFKRKEEEKRNTKLVYLISVILTLIILFFLAKLFLLVQDPNLAPNSSINL